MLTLAFPVCCGATILTGFGNTDTAIDNRRYTTEEIDNYVKRTVSDYRNTSLLFAILNQEQKPIVGPILKKYGFRCVVSDAYHGAHDSYLSTYIKRNDNDHK